jgi:hypothetical protein
MEVPEMLNLSKRARPSLLPTYPRKLLGKCTCSRTVSRLERKVEDQC